MKKIKFKDHPTLAQLRAMRSNLAEKFPEKHVDVTIRQLYFAFQTTRPSMVEEYSLYIENTSCTSFESWNKCIAKYNELIS